MTRDDFLTLIFTFFKVKDDDNQLKKIYDTALSTRKKIDWNTMYTNIIKNVETRYLPAPKWFIDKMKHYEIIAENSLKGKKIIVTYKNGKRTEYVITADTMIKLKNLVNQDDNIVKAELYDVDIAFFETCMFPADAQGKIIYLRG